MPAIPPYPSQNASAASQKVSDDLLITNVLAIYNASRFPKIAPINCSQGTLNDCKGATSFSYSVR